MSFKTVELLDICKPRQWKNLPSSELTEEGYFVYGANGIIGNYTEYNHELPTLVITCRGATCGSLHITKPKSYINSNAMALDNLSDEVNIKYLNYVLFNRGFKDVITGSAQPQITREGLSKIKIPLPSLQEQIRIAGILTQAENLITQRKESILLLDELLKSTFLEMFGDNSYPINTIENISLNIIDCPHSTPKYQDSISDYPCIRTSEIKNGKIDWTSMKYTNHEGYLQRVERLVPQAGDIIFAREGTVGDAAIIPQKITLSLGQRVMLFRINPEYAVAEYFWSLIKSDKIQQIIKSKSIGATVSRINMSEVRKIPCPIPPIELQNQFATIVEKVEVLKSQYQASLKELENMYGVLSQKAFKGELFESEIKEDIKKKSEEVMEELPKDEIDIEKYLKEIEILKANKVKRDITYMSLAEYFDFPEELQISHEKWMFNFLDEDEFYQFLLKNGFKDTSFTLGDLETKFHDFFYHVGDMDFDNVKWKEIIFKFLEANPPLLEQIFDPEDKIIKLKLTDEAYKA